MGVGEGPINNRGNINPWAILENYDEEKQMREEPERQTQEEAASMQPDNELAGDVNDSAVMDNTEYMDDSLSFAGPQSSEEEAARTQEIPYSPATEEERRKRNADDYAAGFFELDNDKGES